MIPKAKRMLAGLVLLALLMQISLFFVGIMDPYTRGMSLWGKNLEERRGIVCAAGRALTHLADQFPQDAGIYLIYPQGFLHMNTVYYFYPRNVSVTMTNARYNTDEEYAQWHEIPSWQWLQTNRFSYVLSFQKDGLRVWPVQPGLILEQHAN
ncbi:MAG: hypothetical protein ABSA12_16180 [Verrucomicrobiia bacterium]|jgi:hypothetical protein